MIQQFLQDPEWWKKEKLSLLFDWATSPEVESNGTARWQLGYEDGVEGRDRPASMNKDYLEGFIAGLACKQ